MPGYLSYAEQSAHYFAREHTRIPEGPVSDPAHWEVSDLGPGEAWRFRLSQADVEEIEAAIAVAREKEIPLEHLRPEDFPLPLLSRRIGDWRETIGKGRGFQVVSGAPVDRWTREESETFFWCLGLHMGKPGAQNPQGDLLGEVRDTGGDETDPFVRLYQTRSSIA